MRNHVPASLKKRWLAKVAMTKHPTKCWLWTGSKDLHGYGQIQYGSGVGPRKAHRIAWTLYNGLIPEGLKVLHKCDTPACCRPSHLFLGTQADNMKDMAAKGRRAHGEMLPQTKLTAAQVFEMRRRQAQLSKYLAKEYKITIGAVHSILRRETWSRVDAVESSTKGNG